MSYRGTTCKRSDSKVGGWECNVCGQVCRTRQELTIHKREFNHSRQTQSEKHNGGPVKGDFSCKYCGKHSTTNSANSLHERCCFNNPEKRPVKGHSMKIFAEKISKGMKKAHSEGRANNWGHLRSKLTASWPELWWMKVIENEFDDKNFIYEMRFHRFSLDFCWIEKKRVIEIDGDQHYKEGSQYEEQRRRDREKDELLRKEGFQELRIPWKDCFNDPKTWINRANEFIGD